VSAGAFFLARSALLHNTILLVVAANVILALSIAAPAVLALLSLREILLYLRLFVGEYA
jgi:hypothetical protein